MSSRNRTIPKYVGDYSGVEKKDGGVEVFGRRHGRPHESVLVTLGMEGLREEVCKRDGRMRVSLGNVTKGTVKV